MYPGDGAPYLLSRDFNGDNLADVAVLTDAGQLSIFLTAVPEPTTLILVLVAAMGRMRRCRDTRSTAGEWFKRTSRHRNGKSDCVPRPRIL
jgi:hypothetical protein